MLQSPEAFCTPPMVVFYMRFRYLARLCLGCSGQFEGPRQRSGVMNLCPELSTFPSPLKSQFLNHDAAGLEAETHAANRNGWHATAPKNRSFASSIDALSLYYRHS